jgi:8-oxo-dGTP pyrophosphatase MutT (NUDIX family)
MMKSITDFAPEGVEAGVGLAIQDESGRYLFFLAGSRHNCPPGELFYGGIGGHREPGEDFLACAQREAQEEVGTSVDIFTSQTTWYVPADGSAQRIEVVDRPRPLAFYEMIHPPGTPREGEMYRIVIFQARLQGTPQDLPPEEVAGVIAMTADQVIRGLRRNSTLAELLEGGGRLVAGGEGMNPSIRLYPLGTAAALAHIPPQIDRDVVGGFNLDDLP